MPVTRHMMLVRAGVEGELVDGFVSRQYVAVGWQRLPDLARASCAEEIDRLLLSAYPDCRMRDGQPRKHYREIVHFVLEMKPGDLVLTVDGRRRLFLVGEVVGEYEFVPRAAFTSGGEPYRHALPVSWQFSVSRDSLRPDVFRETDQRGKTAFLLSPETATAILRAPRLAVL